MGKIVDFKAQKKKLMIDELLEGTGVRCGVPGLATEAIYADARTDIVDMLECINKTPFVFSSEYNIKPQDLKAAIDAHAIAIAAKVIVRILEKHGFI